MQNSNKIPIKRRTISFLKSHKGEIIFLLVILSIGLFLRIYRISEYLMFLGDEGRDVLIVKRMIVDHKFTLLGPTASVGGIYLGPIYYYMMAPFLLLFGFDPVGPAVMVAITGVATIALVYLLGRYLFGKVAGVVASCLYAVSPIVITYSRSSWNPNVLPFWSALLMFSLIMSRNKKGIGWAIVGGLSLGVALQLHYLAFIFLPVVALISIAVFGKNLLKYLGLVGGFLIGFSPFLLFEIRHSFPNTKGVIRFIFQTQNTGFTRQGGIFFDFFELMSRSFYALVTNNNVFWGKVLAFAAIVGFLLIFVFLLKEKKRFFSYFLILIWFLIGILGLAFYRGAIYDYYFSFLYPVPFLIIGAVTNSAWENILGKIITVVLLTVLLSFNLLNSPIIKWEPNNQLEQTKEVSRKIVQAASGKPYNFALLSLHNSDHAYRYFLEIWGDKPTEISDMVEDQLVIVCEDRNCNPYGNSLWEVAAFGQAQIVKQWEVKGGVKILRLVHYPGAYNPAGKPAKRGQ